MVCTFIARKRSLGQDNIFAPVCHSVHYGGVSASVHVGIRTHPRDQTPPPPGGVHAVRYGHQAGGTHPTGMHSCIVLIWVIGICVSFNRLQLEKPNPNLFFFPFLFSPISFCPLKLAPYVFFTKTERHLKKRIHNKLMVRGGYFVNCLST